MIIPYSNSIPHDATTYINIPMFEKAIKYAKQYGNGIKGYSSLEILQTLLLNFAVYATEFERLDYKLQNFNHIINKKTRKVISCEIIRLSQEGDSMLELNKNSADLYYTVDAVFLQRNKGLIAWKQPTLYKKETVKKHLRPSIYPNDVRKTNRFVFTNKIVAEKNPSWVIQQPY